MTKRVPLLSAAVAAALTGVAMAGPLGINFVDLGDFVQNGAPDALLPTEAAGAPGYVQAGWNNFGRWGASVPINDSAGPASGATATWDSANTWNDGAGTATPNAKLMHGYLDATGQTNVDTPPYQFFWNENKPEVYITGLAGWLAAQGTATYDVIVYTDGDATDRKSEYWLQSGSGGDPPTLLGPDLTSHVFVSDVSNFSGTFTQVPLSANTLATAGEDFVGDCPISFNDFSYLRRRRDSNPNPAIASNPIDAGSGTEGTICIPLIAARNVCSSVLRIKLSALTPVKTIKFPSPAVARVLAERGTCVNVPEKFATSLTKTCEVRSGPSRVGGSPPEPLWSQYSDLRSVASPSV